MSESDIGFVESGERAREFERIPRGGAGGLSGEGGGDVWVVQAHTAVPNRLNAGRVEDYNDVDLRRFGRSLEEGRE